MEEGRGVAIPVVPPPAPSGEGAAPRKRQQVKSMHNLLVIDANPTNNWYAVFKGLKGPDGEEIKVEQTEWSLIEAWADDKVHLEILPSPPDSAILGTSQKYQRSFVPDFILVRQFLLGIHGANSLNTLMALKVGNVPSVNSLDSLFFSTQRAMMIGELKAIQRRLGKDVFPLVDIKYYPNTKHHLTLDSYPMVAKVGTSHAGYGKMMFKKKHFNDFATLMAMYNDYITIEPFVKNVGDVRIQKIGDHIRAYRRVVDEGWKGNVGEAKVEDVEVTERYKLWADECTKIFGGLDILSIDALIDEEGNHTILEVNDTATGLNPFHVEEDTARIRDLVLQRMSEAFEQP